jgi:tetratricopeptide (TPR) repeat protein
VFRLIAVLAMSGAGVAAAQLAAPQSPTLERLLILNVPVEPASDSLAAVAVIDAARDRLIQLARYKVNVIPRAKICEALMQSGFPCTALLTDQQSSQLSKALGVNSYNIGQVRRSGSGFGATVRIISGAAGFSASFSAEAGTAGTPQALGEAIAQRLSAVVRAAEYARKCNEARARNALVRALAEANKAFAIEPNLAAANLCVATIREVQHAPPDSTIAAATRALKGDPGNAEAWNRVAQASMVKGDTLGALDAYDSLLAYNAGDANLRKGLASLLLQQKQYERAERLLSSGLKVTAGDQQMSDMRKRVCVEGGLYACTLEILRAEVAADTTKLSDTTELKLALANAQAASDTQSMLWWGRQAVKQFPTSVSFLKQLAGALQLAGQIDSSIAYYQQALAQNPGDVPISLLIAKTIVDAAVWDTAAAGPCQRGNDTLCLRQLRAPLITKLEAARPYLATAYASPDSAIRLTTAVISLGGGSKLAQAGAYDAAYPWLDQLLVQLAPQAPGDTTGPRQAIRLQGSFWFGLSSALALGAPYKSMVEAKSCDQARMVNDRIQRSVAAIDLGGRVAPSVAIQMRNILMQYANQMPKVKQAFKCRNF